MSPDSANDRPYTPGTGLPVAPPVGASGVETNSQVTALSRQLRKPTTSRTQSTHSAGPVGARQLASVEARLSPRDRDVLERIAEHRFLSTTQIQRFAFVGHATDEAALRSARTVLTRLERTGLIRSLGRRVGGFRSGSTAKLFQLAPAGARILYEDGSHFRPQEPSQRFLSHCLAVADVHLTLRYLADRQAVEIVEVETEPFCWRRFVGQGGENRWLQPDLAATVLSRDYRDHWFIEVDLGTESMPTLLRKCARYEEYRATGQEQLQLGTFPLVLWFLDDARRLDRLQQAIERAPHLSPQVYRYATPSSLAKTLIVDGDVEDRGEADHA